MEGVEAQAAEMLAARAPAAGACARHRRVDASQLELIWLLVQSGAFSPQAAPQQQQAPQQRATAGAARAGRNLPRHVPRRTASLLALGVNVRRLQGPGTHEHERAELAAAELEFKAQRMWGCAYAA
jgi:hypothetical protein